MFNQKIPYGFQVDFEKLNHDLVWKAINALYPDGSSGPPNDIALGWDYSGNYVMFNDEDAYQFYFCREYMRIKGMPLDQHEIDRCLEVLKNAKVEIAV